MRKTLLFMASAALLASCTTDSLLPELGSEQNAAYPGVSFQAALDTRGMMEKIGDRYDSYFFAEQDRIDIWYKNVNKGYNSASGTFNDNFNRFEWSASADAVKYKATSSTGNPHFTAIDDENMLGFRPAALESTTGEFFVAYPEGQKVVYNNDLGRFEITPGINLQTQKLGKEYLNFNGRLMYDYAAVTPSYNNAKDKNKSVGEAVNLQLKSPMSMALFQVGDINLYDFGELQEIVITSEKSALVPAVSGQEILITEDDLTMVSGDATNKYLKTEVSRHYKTYKEAELIVEIPANSGVWYFKDNCKFENGAYALTSQSVKCIDPDGTSSVLRDYYVNDREPLAQPKHVGEVLTHIDYDDQFIFDMPERTISISEKPEGKETVNKAVLEVDKEIGPTYQMNLFVLPTTNHSEANKETYTIMYKFDKVQLCWPKETAKNFEVNSSLLFNLKIADTFPYIVTLDRDLIVNSGNIASIFKDGKVKWNDASSDANGLVNPADIKKITINSRVSALTKDEWDLLNLFTNATELRILNPTTTLESVSDMAALEKIYANQVIEVKPAAFSLNNANNLLVLCLPNASKIAAQDYDFTKLEHLELASYQFPNGEIDPTRFFNSSTQTTLRYVDLRNVESLSPTFGYDRNILFTGFSKLEKIYLRSQYTEGTVIAANEFKGCVKLELVDGRVRMETAASAFEGCTSLDCTIYVNGAYIPANAFKGTKVTKIMDVDGPIVPTTVGESAFEGNAAIEVLNLSHATTIGKNAFNGATSFVGNNDATTSNNVVTLIVTTVEENAFKDTKVIRFQLINAQVTMPYSLASSALKQIKYRKSPLTSIDANQVTNKDKVNIFIADPRDQTLFSGYLTVNVEDGDWPY